MNHQLSVAIYIAELAVWVAKETNVYISCMYVG